MNKFDQLAGFTDSPENLDGFLSKVAGKVRSATRKVRKAVKKVVPKPIRKVIDKVEAEGRRAERSGLTKKLAMVAGGVGLAFLGGPAIMAGLKGAGGIAGKGLALAKAGIGGAIKTGGIMQTVKTGMDYKAASDQAKAIERENAQIAAQESEAELAAGRGIIQAIGEMPEFAQVVQQLRAEGYSDQAILAHWAESSAYYKNAVAAATETIQPQLQQHYIAQGVPPQYAESESWVQGHKIAAEEVGKVRDKATGGGAGTLLIPGAILLMTMLGK